MDWDIVAVVAAGLSVFLAVSALLWPRRIVTPMSDAVVGCPWCDVDGLPVEPVTALQSAVDRRGRHLRTD